RRVPELAAMIRSGYCMTLSVVLVCRDVREQRVIAYATTATTNANNWPTNYNLRRRLLDDDRLRRRSDDCLRRRLLDDLRRDCRSGDYLLPRLKDDDI